MRVKVKYNQDGPLGSKYPKRLHRAQMWLDNEVMKDLNPYVPFRTGALAQSVIRFTNIGSGKVVYMTPYARRIYHSRGLNFNRFVHPLATDHWVEPAKVRCMKKWVNGVKKILTGGK